MLRFGIELEIIVNPIYIKDLQNRLNDYKSILIYNPKFNGYLHRDLSIDPNEMLDYGFEIKTKALEYTEKNIKKFKALYDSLNLIVASNDSCGLHVHASRDGFSLLDHHALLHEYIKQGYAKDLTKIDGFDMTEYSYANLNDCKRRYYYPINKALRNDEIFYIREWDDNKTSLYKIHYEFNTIEYRGLRHHFETASTETIMKGIESYLDTMENLKINKYTRIHIKESRD